MNQFIKILFALVLGLSSFPTLAVNVFQSGDLIFHESQSQQSAAIQAAQGHRLTHVGIIYVDRAGAVWVLEASAVASKTPLAKWIQEGKGGKYSVYRYNGFAPAQSDRVIAASLIYVKQRRPYDGTFYLGDNGAKLYCSELVELAFAEAGVKIGQRQRIAELGLNNRAVDRIFETRWRRHPLCDRARSLEECRPKILNSEIITPIALTKDPRVELIQSNF